ncbi:hypothetical protein DFH09DRAFT_1362204 [Mycena vulgaris]|nr:hypothetical protein DFH09DRAFT_1362204 [Mycena vulgaris]
MWTLEIAGFCTAISRGNASYLPTPINNENAAFPRACACHVAGVSALNVQTPNPSGTCLAPIWMLFQRYSESLCSPRRHRNPETTQSFLDRHCNIPGRVPPAVPRLLRAVPPRAPRRCARAGTATTATLSPARPAGSLSRAHSPARPPFTDIARDTLLAAAPGLSGVPAEFIRHGLRAMAPQMLAGIGTLAPSHLPTSLPRSPLPTSLPRSPLPGALAVPLRASPDPAPVSYSTHALPQQARAREESDAGHAIFPVHASSPTPLSSRPTLLATLASPPALHALASHLCAASASNPSALMGHAGHVKELWQEMVALGVYDAELWNALDLAWEVVLGALNLAAQ